MPATRAVDQGLYFGQHASNHSFDFGGGWVQVARLSIVHERIVESRVEEHIVLTGMTKNIAASALGFVSRAGLAPHPAKKHGNASGFEVAKCPRAPREWRLARIPGACRSREVPDHRISIVGVDRVNLAAPIAAVSPPALAPSPINLWLSTRVQVRPEKLLG